MPRRQRTQWLSEAEQTAWRSYLAAHAHLLGELNRRLAARSGLSIGDYEVLVDLSEAPGGRLRIGQLAETMQWERSRLSHHLSRMERRGLVGREGCETDARGAFVAITDAGATALRLAAAPHVADVRELFVEPAGPALGELGELSRRILGATRQE